MRTLCGVGTPRSLQGHLTAVSVLGVVVWARVLGLWPDLGAPAADDSSPFTPHHRFELLPALLHGATRQGWSKGSDDAVTS